MPTNVSFRNPSVRNALRVTQQDLASESTKDPKHGTVTRTKWTSIAHIDVKPNEHVDLWVGPNRRVILEEVPT